MKPWIAAALGRLSPPALLLAALLPVLAAAQLNPGADFSDLSLEELVQIELSSLGRKNASVFNTPAPAYIISSDEIRRSGALNFPELLRLVPGVQVSRVDAANYAVTIRGFNDTTSNKLLVLKDGRSTYNQLFSGTNWTFQEVVLADVSRVEVQRGPAGTLWGANAVNGVINLVSKNAHSTVGSLLSVATGDQFDAVVEARHGWNLNPATAARVYLKRQEQGAYGTTSGAASNGWETLLVGTRLDWDRPGGGGLTVIAEHRELHTHGTTTIASLQPPYFEGHPDHPRTRGTDLSLKWNQPVLTDGHLSIQASVERGDTEQFISGERHTTADFDAQLTLYPIPRHEVISGLTYRSTSDHIRNTAGFNYARTAATMSFVGAFVQDEITLAPNRLYLTLGTKIERNSYSGWETQPSARLLWHPTPTQTIWAAASRAARTPSRAERGVEWHAVTIPPSALSPLPGKLVANGASDFSSEHITAWEAGHRYQPGRAFSIDTSLFYSQYEDLRGLWPEFIAPDFTSFPLHYTYLYTAINNLHGHSHGGEITLRWLPRHDLRFDLSAAAVRTRITQTMATTIPDASISGLVGNTPHEEFKLHAGWDITPDWSLDLYARHTGRLPESGVPAYAGVDARLAWRPREGLEVELIGRDLLDPSHAEISGFFVGNAVREIARSAYLRFTAKF